MATNSSQLDSSTNHEQTGEYWRGRAECLEDWICELLRKNQVLPLLNRWQGILLRRIMGHLLPQHYAAPIPQEASCTHTSGHRLSNAK